jgi:hypothetical protein
MVRPLFASLFGRVVEDSLRNVSGLLQARCGCTQAMMRIARAVPIKWLGHEARFFRQAYGTPIDCFVTLSRSLANSVGIVGQASVGSRR